MARRSPAALVAARRVALRGACMVCGSTKRDVEAVRQEYPQPPWWLCRDKDACRADAADIARPL